MGKFQTHQRFELTAMIYFDLGGTYPLKIRPTQVHPPPPPQGVRAGVKPLNMMYSCNLAMH